MKAMIAAICLVLLAGCTKWVCHEGKGYECTRGVCYERGGPCKPESEVIP